MLLLPQTGGSLSTGISRRDPRNGHAFVLALIEMVVNGDGRKRRLDPQGGPDHRGDLLSEYLEVHGQYSLFGA